MKTENSISSGKRWIRMERWSFISFILTYIWTIIILKVAWLILKKARALTWSMDGVSLGLPVDILELIQTTISSSSLVHRTSRPVTERFYRHTASMGSVGATTTVRTLWRLVAFPEWIRQLKWRNTFTIRRHLLFQIVKLLLRLIMMKLTNGLWNYSPLLIKTFLWSWLVLGVCFLFLW